MDFQNIIECFDHTGKKVSLPREKLRFRPSVYGLIRNGDKIAVCRNKSSGKYWFPGGGIELGENLSEALQREIDEETGLKNVRIGRQLGVLENFFYYGPTDDAMHAFLIFYECHTDEVNFKSNEQVEDLEATDFRWLTVEELSKDDFSDLQDEIFDLLQKLSE